MQDLGFALQRRDLLGLVLQQGIHCFESSFRLAGFQQQGGLGECAGGIGWIKQQSVVQCVERFSFVSALDQQVSEAVP